MLKNFFVDSQLCAKIKLPITVVVGSLWNSIYSRCFTSKLGIRKVLKWNFHKSISHDMELYIWVISQDTQNFFANLFYFSFSICMDLFCLLYYYLQIKYFEISVLLVGTMKRKSPFYMKICTPCGQISTTQMWLQNP